MTQEEKAKRYDEALERAENIYNEIAIPSATTKGICTYIFPELKESEDERIRKELLNYLYDVHDDNEERARWIDWLEKQGEQNHADKVEPKFKVGDWITDGTITIQIEAIKNNCYLYCGDCVLYSIKTVDKVYHLWTIADAKEGDVLVNKKGEMPFIFKAYRDNHIYCYCGYTNCKDIFFDKFVNSKGEELHWLNLYYEQVYPATKEQRDLLFKKMKEAGYEWDAEKKELKKIEQKPAWSEEDKKMFVNIKACLRNANKDYSREVDWLKSIKPQPKNEWSEEDENIFRDIVTRLHSHPDVDKTEYDKSYHWLKSLRPQSHWKPSDEQIDALQLAIEDAEHYKEYSTHERLVELMEELKKFV